MTDGFEEYIVPPTPTRLGVAPNNTHFLDGNESFHGCSQEGSLALLTGEVVEAQKYQASELSAKEEQLKKLQEELQSRQKVCESIQNDVQSANRQLFLTQDKVNANQKECSQLQAEIVSLLDEKRKLQAKQLELKWNGKQAKCGYSKYQQKMCDYHTKVERFHHQNDTHAEILQLKEGIKSLQEQYSQKDECDYLTREFKIQENITELLENKKMLNKEVDTVREQVRKEKENVIILKKEIDALYKRNAAYLARTKRQHKENNERLSRWKKENDSLEQKIRALKKSF